MGGPIWSAPIHSTDFVRQVLESASKNLSTYRRIEGTLNVILEELEDCPLYYTLDKLTGTLHIESPSMQVFRYLNKYVTCPRNADFCGFKVRLAERRLQGVVLALQ